MNAAMVHRGPDDAGVFLERGGGVGLGARRLSVIDVGGGHQPLANEDETVWAVLNGEIYNFPSLREELLQRGHRLATRTDTEVLVHLYEDHGPALVESLEGMYAFAIWDATRKRLLLARDRFGEKPLFYAEHDGELLFASELTALLTSGAVRGRLDPAAIDAYFVYGYVPDGAALVQGVRQLPPGHTLLWSHQRRRAEIGPYWAPSVPTLVDGTPLPDLISDANDLLERSVRSRLLADVPLGVFLSGGVDSSLVAAAAARSVSGTLKTFSVGYDTGTVNETARAARVAALLGTEHHELILSSEDVRATVPRALAALDQPVADTAFVALRALAEHARRLVTVAVGGEGADELFGGYPRYRWLARGDRLPRWFPHSVAARAAAGLERIGGRRADRLAQVVGTGSVFERHLTWVTAGRARWRRSLYGPRLRSTMAADLAAVPPPVTRIAVGGDVAGSLMYLDQVRWLPGDVLVKADRATMQASLELRTPFLDRGLADFAATVPARIHTGGGGKALLRGLLARMLPEHRIGSTKTAFRTPTREWLQGPLRPALEQHLRSSVLYRNGWLDGGAVARLQEDHLQGRRDHSGVLWPLFVLGSWLDAQEGLVDV
jgi:asparagine synthase (glutamine-hydrolysing)